MAFGKIPVTHGSRPEKSLYPANLTLRAPRMPDCPVAQRIRATMTMPRPIHTAHQSSFK